MGMVGPSQRNNKNNKQTGNAKNVTILRRADEKDFSFLLLTQEYAQENIVPLRSDLNIKQSNRKQSLSQLHENISADKPQNHLIEVSLKSPCPVHIHYLVDDSALSWVSNCLQSLSYLSGDKFWWEMETWNYLDSSPFIKSILRASSKLKLKFEIKF